MAEQLERGYNSQYPDDPNLFKQEGDPIKGDITAPGEPAQPQPRRIEDLARQADALTAEQQQLLERQDSHGVNGTIAQERAGITDPEELEKLAAAAARRTFRNNNPPPKKRRASTDGPPPHVREEVRKQRGY